MLKKEAKLYAETQTDGKVVDRITTDRYGRAVSNPLPIGKYTGREVNAPKFFLTNNQIFAFEITENEQMFNVTGKDESKKPAVEIEKHGNIEAMPGQEMSYTLFDIQNNSNCELDNFYFEDVLPQKVRISEIHTGTFNQNLRYRIVCSTNQSYRPRVLADNLSTQISHQISCAIPGLAPGEYITAIRFEFGTVQPGFASIVNPVLDVNVMPHLMDGERLTNTATISGECDGVAVYDRDEWTSVVFAFPDRPLPRTGVWKKDTPVDFKFNRVLFK